MFTLGNTRILEGIVKPNTLLGDLGVNVCSLFVCESDVNKLLLLLSDIVNIKLYLSLYFNPHLIKR